MVSVLVCNAAGTGSNPGQTYFFIRKICVSVNGRQSRQASRPLTDASQARLVVWQV